MKRILIVFLLAPGYSFAHAEADVLNLIPKHMAYITLTDAWYFHMGRCIRRIPIIKKSKSSDSITSI